jgi:ankyrin repeat protein
VSPKPVSEKIRIPALKGPTPLIFAILCERVDIAKYLLETKKARLDVPVEGLFPIHYACIVGVTEIVKLILNASPTELNRPTELKYTPLHIAAANEHLQTLLLLLKLGADPAVQAEVNGNTPLHVAMRNEDTKVAECLIAAHTELLVEKNTGGQFALDLARQYGNAKVVAVLERLLRRETTLPMFEVLYLKYVEKANEQERVTVHQDVIEMICSKVQGYLEGEPVDG